MTESVYRGTFPANPTELEAQLAHAEGRLREATTQKRYLEARERELNFLKQILAAIERSWKEREPGRYGAAVFFLDKSGRPACVEEFLPADVNRISPDEWGELEQFDKNRHRGSGNTVCGYPIIPFSEVMTGTYEERSGPSKEHPVLRLFYRIEGSGASDHYYSARIILNLSRGMIITLHEENTYSHPLYEHA